MARHCVVLWLANIVAVLVDDSRSMGIADAGGTTRYAAARAAMMGFTADGGRKLGVSPTVLLVPPSLEEAGLNLLNTEFGAAGASNPWKGTARLIITPYL